MSIYINNKIQNIDQEKLEASIKLMIDEYFSATHTLPSNDALDLIFIKTACYFDYLINKILGLVYGKGPKIADKSKLKFLQKLAPNDPILGKLNNFFAFRNKFAHDVKYFVSKDNEFIEFLNEYEPTQEHKRFHPYKEANVGRLVYFSQKMLGSLHMLQFGLEHDNDFIIYKAPDPHKILEDTVSKETD